MPVIVVVAAGLVAGVASGPFLHGRWPAWMAWAVLAGGTGLGTLWLWWPRRAAAAPPVALRWSVALALAAAAWAAGWQWAPAPVAAPLPRLWQGSGEVLRVYPSRYRQSALLVLDEPIGERGRLFVRLPLLPPIEAGDSISFAGRLQQEDWGRSPVVVGQAVLLQVERWREDGPLGRAWEAVDALGSHRQLAVALLLGRGRPPEREDFHDAGLLHLLAVSGLHLALTAMALELLLASLGLPWWPRQVLLLGVSGGYLWMTGAAVPTQRALVMLWSLQAARMLGRRVHPLSGVALAAALLALLHPWAVSGAGYQLTVFAVVGIVTLGRDLIGLRQQHWPLRPWRLDRPVWRLLLWLARQAIDGLAIGLAASLAIVPVIAWHFGELQAWSAVASVLATPFLIGSLVLGLLYLLAGSVWPAGPWEGLAAAVDWCLAALDGVAGWVADWPAANSAVAAPPWWLLGAWLLLFLPCRSVRRLVWRVPMILGLVVVWVWAVALKDVL